MEKIKLLMYDIKSIRILFVFEIVFMLIIFCCMIEFSIFNLVSFIFICMLILCIILQICLRYINKSIIYVCHRGLKIISKKKIIEIDWCNVRDVKYNPFKEIFPLLENNTICIRFFKNVEINSKCVKKITIRASKEKYLKIISTIKN